MAEREMNLLKLQKHPMICQIIDVVKDVNNTLCIIMEKYNQSLDNIVKKYTKPIPEKYIVRIFTMICMPLYYMHKNNIVHRDLKPLNIL
jgi:serine/threonine protein kinase